MQNHNLLSRIAAAVFCLFFVGCAIDTGAGRFGGELIAVSKDTVFFADRTFHGIATSDIRSARLVIYDAENLGVFVPIGTASTLSNGWYAIFTMPLWIVGGTIAAVARSYEPIYDFPQYPLDKLAPYARFPQGIPQDLDRSHIRMKAVPMIE
jgi:hypothetical protein